MNSIMASRNSQWELVPISDTNIGLFAGIGERDEIFMSHVNNIPMIKIGDCVR